MMSTNEKVRFKKNWFNPLYFIIRELLKDGISEFYIYGGKSSSKTVSICQLIAVECLLKLQNALIFRKEGALIKTTVKPSLKLAVDMTRLQNGYKQMDFMFRTINGNEIVFRGLDDPEKAKGVEGFSWALWDELNHFTFEEYEQFILSFRGEIAKAFFGTWNPVSENSWVKKKVVDEDEWHDSKYRLPSQHSFVKINKTGNRALIKTIYEDNYWTVGSPCGTYGYRDEKTLAKYERLRLFDDDQYQINVLGNWGVIKPETPYFLSLKRSVNSRKVEDNEEEPVIFSFDFNVKNSVTVWQKWRDYDTEEWHVQCLREIRMGGTENTDLEAICRILAEDYGDRQIYYSGDSSGNNKSALTKGNAEAFKIVEAYLRGFGCEFLEYNKLQSNPRRKKSRFVTNVVTKELGSRFVIDESCSQLWTDIAAAPCNAEGDLDKKFCEENDIFHLGDTLRYFVWVFCFDIWLDVKKNIAVPKEFQIEDNNAKNNAY